MIDGTCSPNGARVDADGTIPLPTRFSRLALEEMHRLSERGHALLIAAPAAIPHAALEGPCAAGKYL